MQNYVLGFAFDNERRVALIKKKRPEWQAGRWNGIGGSIELHETAYEAMIREFYEETGLRLINWRKVATMRCPDVWRCEVYTTEEKLVSEACTQTDEEVRLFSCHSFKRIAQDCIENVPALIELCSMRVDHTGKRPHVIWEYP